MNDKTKGLYHIFLLLCSLALLAGLGIYVQKNTTSFTQLHSVKIEFVVLLVFTHVIGFWFLGMTHKLPLEKNKITLSFKEWYGLSLVAELFNMLLPANGGTGIRMLYLKSKKNLPIREFLTMNFSIILIGFTILGLVGIIYCEFFLQKNNTIFILLESVFVALIISGIVLVFAAEALAKIFNFKRKYSPRIYLRDVNLSYKLALCWLAMFILYPLKIGRAHV